MRRSVYCLCSR